MLKAYQQQNGGLKGVTIGETDEIPAGAVWLDLFNPQLEERRKVDKQLGLVAQQPSTFYDRVKWKTAKLHLSKGFTVSVRTYTGKAVDGDAFPNHLGGMADPP